ncbi:MAG: nucleotide sugar dehydrogenase [Desulfovibrio sp.]|nr:nucleotide sugar dehydrogenase [Desulfovibrio sp.]
MKIAIAGTGYVGLSLAVLLAQHHTVTAVDILSQKIDAINARQSPIRDAEIEAYLQTKDLDLVATLDGEGAYKAAECIIIATPTNYDIASRSFDTSSIEAVLDVITRVNPKACIVIKSTIPVGYMQSLVKRYSTLPYLLFSPEFLREGHALYDNLHPSRIIVGISDCADQTQCRLAKQFADLLAEGALDSDIPIRIVHTTEAECIKLFANSYLAMRVAYFNELDTYAEQYGLDSEQIIEGICLDPRIGFHYNNPSFGYGGYCLPKDTLQLEANFHKTPASLVPAIVAANRTRKAFIVSQILAKHPKTVGIYRLIMKAKSDNFRQSAIMDILRMLAASGVALCIYEPIVTSDTFETYPVIKDLDAFAKKSDVIVANRCTEELLPYMDKVYSRDIYQRD